MPNDDKRESEDRAQRSPWRDVHKERALIGSVPLSGPRDMREREDDGRQDH